MHTHWLGFWMGAFAMSVGAMSCDSEGNAGGDAKGASQFIDDFAAALCEAALTCCPKYDYPLPVDCVNEARRQLHAEIDEDIASGGLHFDSVAAAECVAGARALAPSCPSSTGPAACARALYYEPQGPLPCDGGCAPSDAGRSICLQYSSTAGDGATTSGSLCQVLVDTPPGQACDLSGRMPLERRCVDSNNSACIMGTCTTPKPIGAACAGTRDCIGEATCTGGTCVARTPLGGACVECTTDSQCGCVLDGHCESGTCHLNTKWRKTCTGDFN